MTALAAAGVSIDLPVGWDGQIRVPTTNRASATTTGNARDTAASGAVLHAASFALPADRGDFGSGAVEVMRGPDILLCLLEHEPEAARTALFRRVGVPRLRVGHFSPSSMQRTIAGLVGCQHFFQASGRPFCLYVVLGSSVMIAPLVKAADQVVQSLSVGSPATGGGYDALAHDHP